MAILAKPSILREVAEGNLKIEPFYEDGLQPATYDMRLYWKILVSPTRYSRGGVVDLREQKAQTYPIAPGRLVGILSEEVFNMPLNMAARFGMRSEFSKRGLLAFGGIQIDPGFRGRLTMSLFNAGPEPIDLRLGEKVFTTELQYLDQESEPYEGTYQDQLDFPHDQVEFITNARTTSLEEINHIPAELGHVRQQIAIIGQRLQAGGALSLGSRADLQGFKPLENVEDLVGGWPENADFETFLDDVLGREE